MKKKTLLRKHFRTDDDKGLPNRDYPFCRPLENILNGGNYLENKSRELVSPALAMAINVRRVKSKSKRNGYRVFNGRKPMREGWTIYKHGTIIQTEITCKKISCSMHDSVCRWIIVENAKIFRCYAKHF